MRLQRQPNSLSLSYEKKNTFSICQIKKRQKRRKKKKVVIISHLRDKASMELFICVCVMLTSQWISVGSHLESF